MQNKSIDKTASIQEIAVSSKYDNKLKKYALCIFIIFLLYLMWQHKQSAILLMIPYISFLILGMIDTVGNVGKIAMMWGEGELTKEDYLALSLVGGFVSLVGFFSPSFSVIECNSIVKYFLACVALISLLTVDIFLITTLSIPFLEAISKRILNRRQKVSTKLRCLLRMLAGKCKPQKIKYMKSEEYLQKQMLFQGIKRIAGMVVFCFWCLVDLFIYLVQYVLIWFVYIPLACIVIVVIIAYSLCVRTARRIGEISKRRASSVAFRIAVISAILIVVVLNRMELIICSENATALLEFISSVVVIPLVFEWIHSAFPEKNS